jgi:hypothetical protein
LILKDWLGGLDSNQDSQIQNLESCQLDDLPEVPRDDLSHTVSQGLYLQTLKYQLPTKTNRSTFPSSGQLRFNIFRLNAFLHSVNLSAAAFSRCFSCRFSRLPPSRRSRSTRIQRLPI